MTTELALLAASVVLGIVHIIIVPHLQSWQRGYWWTASSREQSVAPLTGIAASHRDEHAQLAHRVGSPLLLLGSPPGTPLLHDASLG